MKCMKRRKLSLAVIMKAAAISWPAKANSKENILNNIMAIISKRNNEEEETEMLIV